MTSPARRSLRLALLAAVACAAFALSVWVLAPSFGTSLGASQSGGVGVSYTFTELRCVSGTTQYRTCEWLGTVRGTDDSILATHVVYQDSAPDGVRMNSKVNALWSPFDPGNAYDLDASRAYLNILAYAIVSAVGTVVFLVLTVYWWRRYLQDRRATNTGAGRTTTPPRKPVRTGADAG